jgi:hypothetical protein
LHSLKALSNVEGQRRQDRTSRTVLVGKILPLLKKPELVLKLSFAPLRETGFDLGKAFENRKYLTTRRTKVIKRVRRTIGGSIVAPARD